MKIFHNTLPIFSLAQFSLVGLFIFIMVITIQRFTEVGEALIELTTHSVPTINQSSKLTAKIQTLVTLTSQLTFSNTDSNRRLIITEIDATFDTLNNPLFHGQVTDEFFSIQLSVLQKEMQELNTLIVDKIAIEKRLNRQTKHLIDYMTDTLSDSTFYTLGQHRELSKLYLNAAKIEQQKSLNTLRQLETSISSELEKVRRLNTQDSMFLVSLNIIESILIGEDGLINNKIKALRIVGRVRGRGNFVSNLVKDVARTIQFESDLLSSKTLNEGNQGAQRVKQQTRFVLISAIIVVLVSLFFVYYLYKRIVVRLMSLTRQVEGADNDDIGPMSIGGNDEIARLGHTFSTYSQKVKSQEKKLRELSLSDPLTGIPNRRAYEDNLAKAIAQCRRNNWCLSILLIDIDYFKNYNDYYGHGQGDTCLVTVANALNSAFGRSTDICARCGGEEFVVVLINCNAQTANQQAEILRKRIMYLDIPHAKSHVSDRVTVSVGIATHAFSDNTELSAQTLIEQADKALYQAKAAGRNRCEFAQ